MMDERLFEEVFAILDEAFPSSEKRTYEGQKRVLSHEAYHLSVRRDEAGRVIAFLASWEFEDFRFVEHLAVSRAARGGGLGGKLLAEFLARDERPVILEVEPAHDDVSARRIGFYERYGFHLNPFPYVQPPLQEGEKDLPLCIMSYPSPLGEEAFTACRKRLYREVYGRE